MPRTTAKEHVANALLEAGEDVISATKKAEEMLAYFKLSEDLWDLYPNTFSGGERLRLNLAHTMEEIVEMAEKNKVIIREYADKYNLFLTGGSDCHGKYEPNSPEVGDYIAEQSGAEKIVN